jgi:hypothetical protein
VTSQFDSSTPLLYQWSVDILCLSISFRSKVIQHFRLGLNIPYGNEILRVLGNPRPLSACVHQRDPQKAPPCVKPRRLNHRACFATFGSTATRLRENIQKQKIYQKKKVTNSLHFTYAWGRPYPTDCNGSSHIYLGYLRYQSCQFWWLLVEEFGFCEESNLGFSYRKLTHMALNYNTALRYRAGM